MNKLVIVESPSKAKTISKMLGGDYAVMASMGHVRDLPEGSLGVDIAHNFQPQYEETRDRSKNLSDLKKAAKSSGEIYLASDPDREGEAIAWHLKEILEKQNKKARFHRATFHEITAGAIDKAFRSTGDINMNLVNSQQARRVLDRIVGFQVSPLLWSRVKPKISAGRVQSVALRLVCEREREILSFTPQEYWNFTAVFRAETGKPSDSVFSAKLAKIAGDKFLISSGEQAENVLHCVKTVPAWNVSGLEIQPRKRYAAPPFITSTMQQAAGSALGFSANQTMRTAQTLYEGVDVGNGPIGLITYMRTDSVAVAAEAQNACRRFIAAEYGPEYIPAKAVNYRSKSSAQGAHEAIRPTDVNLTPEKIKNALDPQQYKLYTLIWRRFVASQMSPAEQERTTAEVSGVSASDKKSYLFRASATVTRFPGFLRIYNVKEEGAAGEEDDDEKNAAILALLKTGMPCDLSDTGSEQKSTEPPPRYSEATLIKELEANGVGRPSTYAAIVNTIQEREYTEKQKGKLVPTELGFQVNDYLTRVLPDLFQVGFTADMENKLDDVESGKVEWTDMLSAFYQRYAGWLHDAKTADAPESGKTNALFQLMKGITKWENAEPVPGQRNFNEQKFTESIIKKGSVSLISPKQWGVLLSIACKYADQLPDLQKTAEENGFADELAQAREKADAMAIRREEQEIRRQETEAAAPEQSNIMKVFDAMKDIEWEKPVKRRGRTYDDKKFFESLKTQKEGGRSLSEKQIKAFANLVTRYSDRIPYCQALMEECGLLNQNNPEPSQANENTAAAGVSNAEDEAAELLAVFDNFTAWHEPITRRGRVYDDRQFIESLRKQKNAGKKLTGKQLIALQNLADKYSWDKNPRQSGSDEPAAPEQPAPAASSAPRDPVSEVYGGNPERVVRMLDALRGVNVWSDPVRRGNRTYSDADFFRSLDQQAAAGKTLTGKQVAALEKMAAKYVIHGKKEESVPEKESGI